MQVSGLRIYPVKSTGGFDVSEALVQPWGLDADRRWMVVDRDGTTVTARTHRRLLQVSAQPQAHGGITLTAPNLPPQPVRPPQEAAYVPLTLSRVGKAAAAGTAADSWLSRHLGEDVRLVWLDDPRRRTVGVTHGGLSGDVLSFADAGPVLLTTTRSLARLDDWLRQTAETRGEPEPAALPMSRFRPNIVVEGVDEPFAEDRWRRLRIGEVELRLGEHCDRCVLTTIDPVTLASGKEPTRTLALHRQWDHAVFFGIRLIPTTTGVVRVGDGVTVLGTTSEREKARATSLPT